MQNVSNVRRIAFICLIFQHDDALRCGVHRTEVFHDFDRFIHLFAPRARYMQQTLFGTSILGLSKRSFDFVVAVMTKETIGFR